MLLIYCVFRSTGRTLIINIRVRAHFSISDEGIKRYRGSENLTTTVDISSFTLMQLVNFIGAEFVWGSKQFISLYRGENGCDLLRSDEQLKEWLDLNIENGIAHIEAQINDFSGPLQCSPTKRMFHPKVRYIEAPTSSTPPVVHVSTKKEKKGKKRRVYDDDEVVGVDEECTHSDTESLVVLSDSSYDSDLAASTESECDSDYDPDDDIVDSDEDDVIPDFSYDVDDPCIDVDVVFTDVDKCKSAVTHHAILHDYAFTTVKKSKSRFRAKCKLFDKGCKWIFFASTSKKYSGCKVIMI